MKAKIIVVANNKGGVGKTALVGNLGAAFNRAGKRVLLIDLDGQANLTDSMLRETQVKSTIGKAIRKGKALPIHTIREGLDIVPSDSTTAGLPSQVENFSSVLASELAALSSSYDIILIDTAPSMSDSTLSALLCAHYLIVPLTAEPLALKGLSVLGELLEGMQKAENKNLKLLAAVLTFYEGRKKLSKLVVGAIEELFPHALCRTTIRRSVSIAEAVTRHTDVLSFDAKSKGARDYEELAAELLERLGAKVQRCKGTK